METDVLRLSLVVASIGFILWYVLSSSLRLPVRYQIFYDANPPYVNRILRRRTLAVFIYALIPLFILRFTDWVGRPSLEDLNIRFIWNKEVMLYSIAGVLITVILSWLTSSKDSNLEIYPELRIRFWRPRIIILSALTWVIYILAYEFFYRGMLLQSLRFHLNDVTSIAACTALYSLTHYWKLNRVTTSSIVYSVLACWVVIRTDSLIAPILAHLSLALSTEWFSIKYHREMYARRT
ncbi:MAG TPA: CPBP family intramembrane glutamic endopeptidase [Saprospiraceae bacterium]|nr:CPBP family intramembrane glutamic endopeptidase [Saprospiraceae bacterium]